MRRVVHNPRPFLELQEVYTMQNSAIAKIFDEVADLLEIQNANPFRVRAYRTASRTLEGLTESLSDLVRQSDKSLQGIPGIGADLAGKIRTIVETGQLPQLEELRAAIPAGVVAMLRVPGLGPKKAHLLHQELGIDSLDALKEAAQAGRIAGLKGFGKKTEQQILAGLEKVAQVGTRVLLAKAKEQADALVAALRTVPGVGQCEAAGSVRRRKETIGDLDILATAADSSLPMDFLASHPLVEEELARGETKQRVRLNTGLELDLRVVAEESFGAAWQYFTGSKEHNIAIRRRAQQRDLKINEYGVFSGERAIAGRTEDEVYAAVGLPWIPPELREDRGEIELAERHALPNLIEREDIRGDLHMHTTATDGQATIAEMIAAAQARGLEYIAITDHSQRVSMARGLDAARLRAHWRDIKKLREKITGIHVLCGIECDILEDATLDLPDDVLAEADFVIAVLHYGLTQPREQIHARLLHAIRNPHVDMIGHLTGRMLGKRAGADMDVELILQEIAAQGKILEINAHPLRLDVDDVVAAAAKSRRIPIAINTDAHSVSGFDVLQYGVYQARRGGLTAGDVANARPFSEFKKLLRS